MVNHAGGISLVTFVIAVAVSMSYYQFMYVPQANAKPHVPEEVLNPPSVTKVRIVKDAVLQTSPRHFVPESAQAPIGGANKIVWTNEDAVPHSITSDNGFVDRINGKFDSLDTIGLVTPGKTYEFTFTALGDYPYHCEPHPWMKGVVHVVENFS